MSPRSSTTHLVLVPSYNPGRKVVDTVRRMLKHWAPVWIVVDGSDDGSAELLESLAEEIGDRHLRVLRLECNRGKGAAVLHGAEVALQAGFSHALCMDSDGQHPVDHIAAYMQRSTERLDAMILGQPVFDETAPAVRVQGRKLSNFWSDAETLWAGIGDSLFGMRLYPLAPLVQVMKQTRWARGYDFDAEVAVRLVWEGVDPIQMPTPVRYFPLDAGGVSHFRYGRDNVRLTWMHLRLFFASWWRWPSMLVRRSSLETPVAEPPHAAPLGKVAESTER